MKKHIFMIFGMLGLGVSAAHAQIVLANWSDQAPDGWTLASGWTTVGFSSSTGLTEPAGNYSWEITGDAGYGTAVVSPSSVALTTELSTAASFSIDVLSTSGSFGGWDQWEAGVTVAGTYYSFDGGDFTQYPTVGSQSTATWTIPSTVLSALLAHPTDASFISIAIGGGGTGTSYLSYPRITPIGLIESWENNQDGWTLGGGWSSVGFSTTTGVTSGFYSWEITGDSSYGPAVTSPSSTALTAELANASSVSVDVLSTSGSFGGWDQWDAGVVVNGTYYSFDGGDYTEYPAVSGAESGATWTVPASVNDMLLANPSVPCALQIEIGGGGTGTTYLDNVRYTPIPPAAAQLAVRELWDDISSGPDLNPTATPVGDDSSSLGFVSADPWVPNPAQNGSVAGTPDNTQLMQFRGAGFESSFEGAVNMGLPGSLDGTEGFCVQQNGAFSFFPGAGSPSYWTAGDFMTRPLAPNNYINFQAVGEYWFEMTVQDYSSDSQYVEFPSSGGCGIGFADGSTTNADFVAVGLTPLNLYLGPGATNASSSVYISQGTLGQQGPTNGAGVEYSVLNWNPIDNPNAVPADSEATAGVLSSAPYSETNFTDGPYYVRAYGADTQGQAVDGSGDGIVVLGHLRTFGNGSATLDAKYYYYLADNAPNYNMDLTTNGIVWDCSYSFNFGGTLTEMLLFENGQFSTFIDGFRASTNMTNVLGIDAGRIAVSPSGNTYAGYTINLTNLTVEANIGSFPVGGAPAGYGTLTNQWFKNGTSAADALNGQTSPLYTIASATTGNSGTYYCVTGDISGQWGTVTNSVTLNIQVLPPPTVTGVQAMPDQTSFQVVFSEPNLNGVSLSNNYVFNNGVQATNVTVIGGATNTLVQLQTTTLPLGTKETLTIGGVTNAVGDVLPTTNITFWTDLVQAGVANFVDWTAGSSPNSGSDNTCDAGYFGTWVPGNPTPAIVDNLALTDWEIPTDLTLTPNQYPGNLFGDKTTGWFIPPVTGDYVFFISCDDGGRLSLSTNSSDTNLCVIACETEWNDAHYWTNMNNTYDPLPHRGDGTATAIDAAGLLWDNSAVEGSPATADDQNRSDQFIVSYYDSLGGLGLPGEPAGVTSAEQTQWQSADSQTAGNFPPAYVPHFWPHTNSYGQAEITLTAGKMYYMQLEHFQSGGGYDGTVTYKQASAPDPVTGTVSTLTGDVIAGLVPFTPTISISAGPPVVITYTGVLRSSTSAAGPFTTIVAQSSGGPSTYTPPAGSTALFYITGE
jgi:hypothetical protein